MLLECPSFLVTILPMGDGTCPACRKDARFLPESVWSRVTIRAGARMPDLCMLCAQATKHRTRLCEDRRVGGEDSMVKLILILVIAARQTRRDRDANRP